MCFRPQVLYTRNTQPGLYQLSGLKYRPSHLAYEARPWHTNKRIVPCGKCMDCLKKRQNGFAIRFYREAIKRGSFIFVTLTYKPSMCPLRVNLVRTDIDSGEEELLCSSPLLRSDSSYGLFRGLLSGMKSGPFARVLEYPFLGSEDSPICFDEHRYFYSYKVTPSLYREDVKLWLKSARVAYKREFGVSLPDFSYACTGEYGPRTTRPHYHLGFFGLDKRIVSWIVSRWSERFGFAYVSQIPLYNEDGSSGFAICAKYIAKYMSKGKFEADSVSAGLAEKPRLQASLHLGTDLDSSLISYYRCYDLFGEYDIDTCRLKSGSFLSRDQLLSLAEEVRRRSVFTISGFNYSLPPILLKKLWYVPSEKNDGSFRASQVRNYFSSLVQDNLFENFIRSKNFSSDSFGEVSALVSEFVTLQTVRSSSSEEAGEEAYRSFLKSSIF